MEIARRRDRSSPPTLTLPRKGEGDWIGLRSRPILPLPRKEGGDSVHALVALSRIHWRQDSTRSTLVLAAFFTAYWLIVLRLDAGTDLTGQVALGVTTWLFLITALGLSPRQERVQVLAMVVVATGFECFSSLLVGFYRYRLDNLPMYVPPGHGLFFLLALRVTALPWIERHHRLVIAGVTAFSVVLAFRGAFLLPVADRFGLGAWVVLLGFLAWGSQRRFYAVSFAMTMALEFYGTGLGLWAWAPMAPLVGLPAANPPAGIGAGYCVMDAIARLGAASVERMIPFADLGLWFGRRLGQRAAGSHSH